VDGGGLRARVNQLTHHRTNGDGWCTDGCTFFVPPCPWANQGGELRLTFFNFSLPQPRLVFLGTLFFLPLTPTGVSPTYLHLDYLSMHPGFLPHDLPSLRPATYLPTHLPTYLLTHLPANLCTYALNFHQGP
jgi:hypothetical protein